jgi:hypothetical protein
VVFRVFRNCDDCIYNKGGGWINCKYKQALEKKGITPETYAYCPYYLKRGGKKDE